MGERTAIIRRGRALGESASVRGGMLSAMDVFLTLAVSANGKNWR